MTYTVLSACYANAEGTAAVLKTVQAGDVLVSPVDTPALWELLPAEVEPYAPLVTVPAEVTMRQARRALRLAGKLAQVEAAIDGLPEPQRTDARIDWDHSQTVQRHRPLVQLLAPALGLSESDLDQLFILARDL